MLNSHSSSTSIFNRHSLGVALLSSIPLWFPSSWGAHWMYPLTVPWIVYWTHVLMLKGFHKWYVSFVLWIPAIGMITWQRAIFHLDLQYLKPSEGIEHVLKLMWQNHQHGWALLFGSAIGAWFVHRRMCLVLLLIGLTNGISQFGSVEILRGFHHADWNKASCWLVGIECSRVFALLPLWIGIQNRTTPHIKMTTFLLSLLALWLTAPFISFLLWRLPVSTPTVSIPESMQQLGSMLSPANPTQPEFSNILNTQGTSPLPKARWWCTTEAQPNWKNQLHAFALLEMNQSDTLETLSPYLPQIFVRGVTHIGMLTKHNTPHWYPPLNKHLQFPTQHWLLLPPPETTRIAEVSVGSNDVNWVREGDEYCTLTAPWDISIQQLSEHHDRLQEEYKCVSPIFLSINPIDTVWSSPVPCPI
jgi:hypothetical protein